MGTNQLATTSARRWIGAFEPWAASTIRIIWLNIVPCPTRVARMVKLPVLFSVAP